MLGRLARGAKVEESSDKYGFGNASVTADGKLTRSPTES
jgi:hypothetical protein